jgi:hypothetical protein
MTVASPVGVGCALRVRIAWRQCEEDEKRGIVLISWWTRSSVSSEYSVAMTAVMFASYALCRDEDGLAQCVSVTTTTTIANSATRMDDGTVRLSDDDYDDI